MLLNSLRNSRINGSLVRHHGDRYAAALVTGLDVAVRICCFSKGINSVDNRPNLVSSNEILQHIQVPGWHLCSGVD